MLCVKTWIFYEKVDDQIMLLKSTGCIPTKHAGFENKNMDGCLAVCLISKMECVTSLF